MLDKRLLLWYILVYTCCETATGLIKSLLKKATKQAKKPVENRKRRK